MPDRKGLVFRTDYFGDAAAWRALAAMLEDIFGIDVTMLDRLGGPDPTSAPFAWFDASGRCIANISAFSMPLVIDGTFVRAAGLQSGAVRPDYRGQGLFRSVMEAALDHCDSEGFEAVALLTDKPTLYENYGFRTLPQHRFAGPAPTGGRVGAMRHLDIARDADVTLLRRLLNARRPVSDRFAPLRQAEMFLFNAALMPDLRLSLLENENTVIAWQSGPDGVFALFDVAGASVPTLADILASLRISPSNALVHFAPDHLDWEGEALADAGDMVLMLRGAENLRPERPFALPPMAEF
ncbi:GNAT family N-acetyltransferase [Shinella sp. CPCC 101442]|uniref:GNAT family N-acetyltransferase n=1 Tax=Shinella sp. CPCC 101442 TaxID=2932265 RepID=UPI00215251F5|nr:GNAT family N-acetyltransferase [Shinella sp. CPCC 101442]MCR6500710.1 GNAT family N-acetyltransferase [Shinella sp. CPCC 101442]